MEKDLQKLKAVADICKIYEDEIKRLEQENERIRERECKAFANWLSNTVIAGRTITKLWNDYVSEVGNPDS